VVVYFGQFLLKITEEEQIVWLLFPRCKMYKKHGLGYTLGDFLQTHLVTLLPTSNLTMNRKDTKIIRKRGSREKRISGKEESREMWISGNVDLGKRGSREKRISGKEDLRKRGSREKRSLAMV
jgi:hypothetical protein